MAGSAFRLHWLARRLHGGAVIGYPTEAVFGLGCDPLNPHAFARLLALKARSPRKGVILIASDYSQLEPYLGPLPDAVAARVLPDWPGPRTWLLPAATGVPAYLTGGRDTLAVRVTAHPVAAALCRVFGGALVSTSANKSGYSPARSALRTRLLFGTGVDYVVSGAVGGLARPTPIRDGRSGELLRA